MQTSPHGGAKQSLVISRVHLVKRLGLRLRGVALEHIHDYVQEHFFFWCSYAFIKAVRQH